MNLKIQNRHWEVTQSLERLIDRQSRKLQKILPTFASHDLDLHVTLEKLPRGKQYHTVLVLNMPQNAMRVEEMENNPTTSVIRAFEELLRKIKKFKSRLNRERFWQKQAGVLTHISSSKNKRELENAINQNLDQLENYIRRELYHQVLVENIPVGLVQAQALLDEVFLEVTSKTAARPENIPLQQWMFQIARERVRNRIHDWQAACEELHVEETAKTSSRWDDEVLNFYQPDEVLRLEDLLRDEHSTTPEELLAREEVQEQLQEAIVRLPSSIRESFVLFALEGFNSDETAMIMGKDPSEVLEDVEKARLELRRRMNRGRVFKI
ncbi:HPF/RaiA family ribosome-associated protein [Acidobacteria bacterium AH-259-O06]|nr:HPF/RaiA family ribosome-associated protein [Acidobacteria bacterium AH-259-O06]